ncbi:TetR/AcrR family transcriptional regulator [Actinomadura sp. NEAU-AAG7]|uniref:TetR/AcrR family transcriptional regulator n=1 Tax=Actinomadura sp. NEAU-AAG7 TaxID=2839640 RepID=UPI001BE489E1|nr:TetR/AcrR family transcriptional regulator [Actinomadura sp. NEAU-AAG7]MBT2212008.1 TetR family transcriptional regulator [Actinomadura sp. NEAU-AAG7]
MTETSARPGRRERKKAATRRSIADTALRLFLERGYDGVGVREIAEAADVSVSTLFKHFPGGKEALVFDEDADREAALVAAVTGRSPGRSVPDALRAHLAASGRAGDPRFGGFQRLVQETPELREHSRRMLLRHANALARAIAEQAGRPPEDDGCAALARLALEVPAFAADRDDPSAALDRAFALLEHGWTALTSPEHPTA